MAVTDKNGKIWKFERDNSASEKLSRANACSNAGGRYGTPIYLKLISWTKYNDGCMDTKHQTMIVMPTEMMVIVNTRLPRLKLLLFLRPVLLGVSDQVNFF